MLRLYSFYPDKATSAYDVQKAWRAKQAAYNDTRLNIARTATSSIFTANFSYVQTIGELAVKQAVNRMTSSVNKTV